MMNLPDHFGGEGVEAPYLFLPEGVMNALRGEADGQSRTLRQLLDEQVRRLLCDPVFAGEALKLADALWERLDRGPAWPFTWPVDPLVCFGGAVVFAADLQHEADQDLLRMKGEALDRLEEQARARGVSHEQLVAEALRVMWENGDGSDPDDEAGPNLLNPADSWRRGR